MAKATIITLLPHIAISPINQLGLDGYQTVFLQCRRPAWWSTPCSATRET
jgi:hypothetical protein